MKQYTKLNFKKGFLLYEVLIGLVVSSISIYLGYQILNVLTKIEKLRFSNQQDILAVNQIQEMLLIAENIELTNYEISYYINEQKQTLIINEKRIYKTPGYNVILHNFSDAYFISDNNYFYLVLENEKYLLK